ncbi:TonB-dependent receptor plug domain-containing protein [Niabella aurantiaca]|uniref:TonB-dependent receptor plug domain-containing protein n=1 Tax=Niabella aurantiaca TaxID=379900 RepID=UPI001B7FD639|nr:TonB-dependent receptor [Niabella aurantiaca]
MHHKTIQYYLTACLLLMAFGAQAQTATADTAASMLDAVTVTTGQYQPQSLRKSVYDVRVITAAQIQARGAVSVMQVLNTQLGMRLSNDNTLGVTDIQLMGMSGRSIKILLDGVPVTDRNDTRESLSQIDVQTIDRIEIVEGPMSVAYGSDALAGVINIITRDPGAATYSIRAKVQEETAGNEYYPFSYQGLHQQSVSGSYKFKAPLTISAGINHILFNGVGGDAYGRQKAWLPKEQYLGHLRAGYHTERNKFHYRLDVLEETITKKGALNLNVRKAFDQRYQTRRYMHQLQDQWKLNDRLHFSSFLSYTDYRRRTKSTNHNFETGEDVPTTGTGEQDVAKFQTLFFRTQGVYALHDKLSLQPGVEISRDNASGNRIKGSPVITDYALFASAEYKPSGRINIRPGLRMIKNSIYDAPPVVPALNIKLGISAASDLRLSYAQGYRAPALRELYFDFVDANHTIYGNPDLKAEISRSLHLSWNTFLNRAAWKTSFSLSAFYNVFDDLIDYAADPNNSRATILFNVSKFKTAGMLLQQGFIIRQLQVDWGVSYIGRYNRLKEADGELPELNWSPEANAAIYYNMHKPKLQLALIYKFTGARKQYQLKNGADISQGVQLTKMDAFHWADFSVTKKLWSLFAVQAGVKNILNISNINSTIGGDGAHSSSGPVPVSYGRSYFIGLDFRFNKQ